MGSGKFAAVILKKMVESGFKPAGVFTQPDRPVGRHQTPSPSPAKITAQKKGLKIFEPRSLKNDEAEKMIKSLNPDLIVVADYGKIIPKNILNIPKFGALNVHPSLLPKHRGAAPIQNTILEGDEETGVTIISMDEKVDHGPIVGTSNLQSPISKISRTELSEKLADLGAELLTKTFPLWITGEIKPKPQDEAQATYTKILTKEEGKIDWQNSAEKIERKIRALEGWPGTWCEWETDEKKMRLKILKSQIFNPASGCKTNQTPGFVFMTEQKELAVNCNPGGLILDELQLEGKEKISGKEFLRGYPKIIGAILN